ncbi:hypothetical protein GCM10010837_48570 [Aminobacter niigataensis]
MLVRDLDVVSGLENNNPPVLSFDNSVLRYPLAIATFVAAATTSGRIAPPRGRLMRTAG